MPSYSYRCKSCKHEFTALQRMTEDALTDCPKCEGSVERVIGKNVGIQFMGSGFYVNDANEKGAPST